MARKVELWKGKTRQKNGGFEAYVGMRLDDKIISSDISVHSQAEEALFAAGIKAMRSGFRTVKAGRIFEDIEFSLHRASLNGDGFGVQVRLSSSGKARLFPERPIPLSAGKDGLETNEAAVMRLLQEIAAKVAVLPENSRGNLAELFKIKIGGFQ